MMDLCFVGLSGVASILRHMGFYEAILTQLESVMQAVEKNLPGAMALPDIAIGLPLVSRGACCGE
jgi:hypothetical protein